MDAYREQYGELPVTLEDAGSAVQGVEYFVIEGNRYELIATIGTEVVRYDSSESANEWIGPNATSKLRGGVLMSHIQRRDARRGGFTLIELMIAASIVGILAGFAIPNLQTMIYRARATDVAADMEVVRVATLNYQADLFGWPPEAVVGAIPTGLDSYLPEGFTFLGDGYQLDFESWSLPGGLPGDPNTTVLIGVSVVAAEDDLGNAIAEFLSGAIVFSVGNTHTIVIDRS